MNKKIISLLAFSATILVSLSLISQANAGAELTKDELEEYNANNISFYLPCGGGNNSGICGNNKNYAGEQVWTDAQMEALKANQPFYEKAAGEYNFPWQILAVIHMREHGLARSNPDNGQGVYQFYSASSRSSCSGGNFTPGPISDEQFQIQTNCAAKKIAEGYGSGLDLNTDDGVKKMFFKYNGTAQAYIDQALSLGFSQEEAKNGEGSPYVMNRYDKKREPSSTWGQIKSDGDSIEYPANNDFGAFVYYKAIYCGNSSSSGSSLPACNSCEQGSMNLNGTAVCLAWPLGEEYDKKAKYISSTGLTGRDAYNRSDNKWVGGEATEMFNKALETVYPEHKRWSTCPEVGASCDVGTAVAVRYSGVDPDFPRGLDGQKKWAEDHPDLWEVIKYHGNESELQPGDVIWCGNSNCGHVKIYVQDSTGKGYIAESGLCRTFFHIRSFNTRGEWILRPRKAKNSTAGVDVKNGVTASSITGTVSNTTQGSHDINGTAISFSWPAGTAASKYDLNESCNASGTETFTNYFNSVVSKSNRDDFSCSERGKNNDNLVKNSHEVGAACCIFTAAALKYAGLLPENNYALSHISVERLKGLLTSQAGKDSGWEEISNKSNLQPGDVILTYTGNDYQHAKIYVEVDGKGYYAQARNGGNEIGDNHQFAHLEEKKGNPGSSEHVFRNKNNTTSSSTCDMCPGGDENGELKDGGYTSKEDAEKDVMTEYKNLSNAEASSKYHINAGCGGYLIKNCPSFVRYFVNKYTTKTWTGATGNGSQVADNLAKLYNLPTSTKPQPYAVFSTSSGSTMCGATKCGHTGVVLGVNSATNKIIIGEAGCSASLSWIGAHEYNLSEYSNGSYTYVYLDSILKTGSGLTNAQ